MKEVITESQLRNIVAESVKKVLKEEIDMGQIMSAQERREQNRYNQEKRDLGNGKEYSKRIHHLRIIIDDVEAQFGKDAADGISLKIKELKQQWAQENGI